MIALNPLQSLVAFLLLATSTLAVAQTDIFISNSTLTPRFVAGIDIEYRVEVHNPLTQPAVGARVVSTFPPECETTEWTCFTDPEQPGGACSTAQGTGTLDVGVDIAVAGSVYFDAHCRLRDNLGGATSLVSTASLTLPPGFNDPNPANNTAVATIGEPVTGAFLQGTMTAAGNAYPGGIVTFTAILTNIGPGVQNATGPEMSFVLPSNKMTDFSVEASSGVASFINTDLFWDGSIAAGASVTIRVSGRILPEATGLTGGQLFLSFDTNGDGTSDFYGFSDDPGLPGHRDPTGIVIGGVPQQPPNVIPATTPTALLMLAIALMILARRQRGVSR